MAYEVIEEDPDRIEPLARAALEATRGEPAHPRRFAWLYRANPDGAAVVWSVRRSETGEFAGFTAGLPRRMFVSGRECLCWNCSDFSIYPRFRALGVAVKLRRAATE